MIDDRSPFWRWVRIIGRVLVTGMLLAVSAVSSSMRAETRDIYRRHPLTPASGGPPDAQSTTGPTPPADVALPALQVAPADLAVTIPGVPAYHWHHGCGPTAAGMVIGYWDGQGYAGLVPGDADSQTEAVNAMMATEGHASNYTDYCEPIDSWPVILPDLSEPPPGDEHSDECLADYMKTSQSYFDNLYGWGWFSHLGPGMEAYTHQMLGRRGGGAIAGNLYTDWDQSLNWDSLRAEIDANRPLVLLVDTNGNAITDHFVTAVGYGMQGDRRYYACLNTWDDELHWFEFAPMAQGQPWGVFGGVTFRILALDQHVYCPLLIRD